MENSGIAQEVESLEHGVLKVPFEEINKMFRTTHKTLESEMKSVQKDIESLGTWGNPAECSSKTQIMMKRMTERLMDLRRKTAEAFVGESRVLEICAARINHLNKAFLSDSKEEWQAQRIDRVVIDYLLREGFYDTAVAIAKEAKLDNLVDLDVFAESRVVEQALLQKNCQVALDWCKQYEKQLTKKKSSLEFSLRLQQFIEIIKQGRSMDAVNHANTFFPQFAERHIDKIKRAMNLLVFHNVDNENYKDLLDESRWSDLLQLFRRNNLVLHNLKGYSAMRLTLQSGLSAMKTHSCYLDDQKRANCPVCDPHLNELAKDLAHAHHINSSLVCRLTGKIMDENNPPTAMPSGAVYGRQSLADLTASDDTITIPDTQESCHTSELRRVFVM